jgi:hypothetical protein
MIIRKGRTARSARSGRVAIGGQMTGWIDRCSRLRSERPALPQLYVKGGHAFGLRPTESPITRWPQLLAMWLDDARHCFEGESENVGASLF